jgi:hypothetical protein
MLIFQIFAILSIIMIVFIVWAILSKRFAQAWFFGFVCIACGLFAFCAAKSQGDAVRRTRQEMENRREGASSSTAVNPY